MVFIKSTLDTTERCSEVSKIKCSATTAVHNMITRLDHELLPVLLAIPAIEKQQDFGPGSLLQHLESVELLHVLHGPPAVRMVSGRLDREDEHLQYLVRVQRLQSHRSEESARLERRPAEDRSVHQPSALREHLHSCGDR